jgi:mono/diheme cytochrome c family protein
MNLKSHHRSIAMLLLAAILPLIAACSTPQGNAEDGKRWYMMHNCFACHGKNGSDGKGPMIGNPDMSFYSFLRSVRNAGSPIMPEFPETKIPKQDVADIYAWLKSK